MATGGDDKIWKYPITTNPKDLGRTIQAILFSNPNESFSMMRDGDDILIRLITWDGRPRQAERDQQDRDSP